MAMTLLTTNTSTGDATSSFTSNIDSTYKLYKFMFYDVNPATDNVDFSFQANASSQSGYNETMTTSAWTAYVAESGGTPAAVYWAAKDQAQGTAFQPIAPECGNGGDESSAGILWLFNPSNTTYLTHFYSSMQQYQTSSMSQVFHAAGYFNVTAAITNIQFKMSSGNMDAVIKLYGVG